jgi:hypothetical protein
MLTIHDCTFQVSWSGWGPATVHAERVALGVMLDLLEMSPDSVRRIAQSPGELDLTARVARARVATIIARRGRAVPLKASIVLEAL